MLAPVAVTGQDTLRSVEQQINQLHALKLSQRGWRPFPRPWEQSYLQHRQQRFMQLDLAMLVVGLVLYLAFAWADWLFGGQQAVLMVCVRMLLGLSMGVVLWHRVKRCPDKPLLSVVALGIALVGISIVAFTTLLESSIRFAYHVGLIPVQVFAMVVLRSSARAFLMCSLSMLISYLLASLWFAKAANSQVESALLALRPLFLLFWCLMILLGAYLALTMERISRQEFIQQRLLELEAQRQQQLVQQLHHLSITDGLTGLYNRRYFEQVLQDEWQRARRYQQPIALLMIDVDDFKAFNDCLGHPAGDAALQCVASQMTAVCRRSTDLCARYGGEEFIMLLADTDQQAAQCLAEKLRQHVYGLALAHPASSQRRLTVSIGVASTFVTTESGAEALLQRADQALYQAKHLGRNQVCCDRVLSS